MADDLTIDPSARQNSLRANQERDKALKDLDQEMRKDKKKKIDDEYYKRADHITRITKSPGQEDQDNAR